jgi:hypothetical protein
MNDMLMQENEKPEIDGLLRDYFQAEMPRVWPVFRAPLTTIRTTNRPASFWSRYGGRVALAACVTVLAAGYLSLASYFPHSQAPSDVVRETGDIGMKGDVKTPKPKNNADDALPMPMPMPH